MGLKRKHRRKTTYEGNPEIQIRVEVLRVAMEENHLTPSALARAIGDRQQTISALLNSTRPDRRCRADRAQAIARVLQIPFEWLTEGVVVPPVHPFVFDGYEFRYSVRTQFAASRLFTRCAEACLRDLSRTPHPSVELSVEMVVGQLVGLMAELIQIGRWRHWLLDWNPDVQERRGYSEPASDNPFGFSIVGYRDAGPDEPPFLPGYRAAVIESQAKPQKDDDHETAIVSLCRAIEHVFTPWFEDQARLNYEALYRLTALPGAIPARTDIDPYVPAAAISGAVSETEHSAAHPTQRVKKVKSTRRKTALAKRRRL
jgi:hypothetical protein